MSEIIILTNRIEESKLLSQRLETLDPNLKGVPCLTKKDLTEKSDVRFIFSTWYMPIFTEKEIETFFPKLEAIFYAAGTVKQFSSPFLKGGVRIFSAAKANGISVAEFTVGQILLSTKGYFKATRAFRWPIWRRKFNKIRREANMHTGNYEANIGLLGCGEVGSKVVELLHPYDFNIKVYDPFLPEERINQLGVTRSSIEDIFSTCDIISNHLPDVQDTKGIIGVGLLNLMKPHSTLINTGRGAQLNEKDLSRFLHKRKDVTALLDVTRHEPPYPWSGLFLRKNIFMSPHLAGSSGNEVYRMIDFIYKSYREYLNGGKPEGEVIFSELAKKA